MPYPVTLLILLAALSLPAQVVTIDNPNGAVEVRIEGRSKIQVRGKAEGRQLQPGEVQLERLTNSLRVTTRPADGARVDVTVTLPYGSIFQATTRSHEISVKGLVARALVTTQTGDIRLHAPWGATRLTMQAAGEPESLVLPERYKFSRERKGGKDQPAWQLQDNIDGLRVTYGRIDVRAGAIRSLELKEIPIPADSPVKMPWQAPPVIAELLKPAKAPKPAAVSSDAPAQPRTDDEGLAVFRSDVNVVALNVSVYDEKGAPLTGLTAADFEVLEDGAPQEISHAGSEEVPFNLAILLDLSGSTRDTRPAMQAAVRGFLNIARPQDRIALYALANDWFTVVSRLTADRSRIENVLDAIPAVSGSSPIYDSIALGYAEEFLARPNERNALIVLTDGADNQISGTSSGVASEVSFKRLKEAAAAMPVLIYPVVLDPFSMVPPPRWLRRARENMEELAKASGGRSFPANSAKDLDPVFPRVADELRSVYSLSYSPRNQSFQGEWRSITVKVKRPGARTRTRAGYFARQ